MSLPPDSGIAAPARPGDSKTFVGHRRQADKLPTPPSTNGDVSLARLAAGIPSLDELRRVGCRYLVRMPYAKGGLGQVFLAEDTELGRTVALKEIQPHHSADEGSRERFVQEAEVTGSLEHPGIVPIYGLGRYSDGQPFYAMRFIHGETMKEAIARMPAVDPRHSELKRMLRRFMDVCNAVSYAHARGVLHRDLKPSNIMLGPFGETLVVDWGLAKILGKAGVDAPSLAAKGIAPLPASDSRSDRTEAGSVVGTPGYLSPEQARGECETLTSAADIYSLGAVLHTILIRKPPFEGDLLTILDKTERGEFTKPRQVDALLPAALEAISLKAMATEPKDRYATARALADDVERWLDDQPVLARRETPRERVARWQRSHPATAATIAAGFLTAAVGLGIGYSLISREQRRTEEARVAAVSNGEAAREQAILAVAAKEKAEAARNRTRKALDDMTSTFMIDGLRAQTRIGPEQRNFLNGVLGYYREFAAESADDPASRQAVADAAYRLGRIEATLGRDKEAFEAYKNAYDLARAMSEANPSEELDDRLAFCLFELGSLHLRADRPADSDQAMRESLAIRERMLAARPGKREYEQDIALCWSAIASAARAKGDISVAVEALRRGAERLEALRAKYPEFDRYAIDLSQACDNLGLCLADAGRREEAALSVKRSIGILEDLYRRHPTTYSIRNGLGASYCNMAYVMEEREAEDLEPWYDKALAVLEPLARELPGDGRTRHFLTNCYWGKAMCRDGMNDPKGALETWRKAAPIASPRQVEYVRARVSFFLMRTGQDKESLAEADGILQRGDRNPTTFFLLSLVYCHAADTQPDARDGLLRSAMECARRAKALGYHDMVVYCESKDFELLSELPDFGQLFEK